ncbi:type II secretion system F family protein [Pseudarthrobacter sulfonivorans]|uniref:type II secretion system F family protein n=1 Tax=Pseudarthrobacter sulfonivorans TaxID=121292 RepID=UPI002104B581|nr:type II secretion system F family protein [Pseudarthrobacter sulfonivorans]
MTETLIPGVALGVVLIVVAWLTLSPPGRARRRLLRISTAPVNHQEGAARADALGSAGGKNCPDGLRDTAMMLELVGAMLDAGSGIGRSLELVAASASRDYSKALRPVVSALAIGADWETAWRSSEVRLPEILELRDALGFAALTGAPSSAILYAQAARLRRERFRAAEKRAAALGVKLVIPLGLCSLPAFICLGVVPVLLALVPSGS